MTKPDQSGASHRIGRAWRWLTRKGLVSGDRRYGHAYQAIYEAKREGRNRVGVFGLSAWVSAAGRQCFYPLLPASTH